MKEPTAIFWWVLAGNALIAAMFLCVSLLRGKREPGLSARITVMLLCPVVGPVYFGLGWVLRRLFFHKPVDLTDVIFTKERSKTLLKADEESESGLVPVEDAVTVVDRQNAREFMLEVLRRDVRRSLGSIFLALNSDDSEISHYAASALQSELGKFRLGIQNIVSEIDRTEAELREGEGRDGELKTPAGKAFSALLSGNEEEAALRGEHGEELRSERKKEDRDPAEADRTPGSDMSEDYARHKKMAHEQGLRAFYGDDAEDMSLEQKLTIQVNAAHKLLQDLHEVLEQQVLSEMESAQFTELADRMARLLEKRDRLSSEEMAWVAGCWLLRGEPARCREWSRHLALVYPGSLEAYSVKLKLLYREKNWTEFRDTLEALKASSIPLDHEMMEMVRVFM